MGKLPVLSAETANILAFCVLATLGAALLGWIVMMLRRSPFTPAQSLLYAVNYGLVRILWRAKIRGSFPIPPGRGAVIVCNHRCPVDPSFLAIAVPRAIHWLVAQEYYEYPGFRHLLRLCEVIPVRRGAIDPTAVRVAIRLAKRGELVGIFPEGRINTTEDLLLPGRSGAALIALKAGAPIVPCYIHGAPYDGTTLGCLLMPATVRLEIGSPIDVSAYVDGDDRRHRTGGADPSSAAAKWPAWRADQTSSQRLAAASSSRIANALSLLRPELLTPEDRALLGAERRHADQPVGRIQNVRPVSRRVHPRSHGVAAVGLAHGDVLGHGPQGVNQPPAARHPGRMFAGRLHQFWVDPQRRQAVSGALVIGVRDDVRLDQPQLDAIDFLFVPVWQRGRGRWVAGVGGAGLRFGRRLRVLRICRHGAQHEHRRAEYHSCNQHGILFLAGETRQGNLARVAVDVFTWVSRYSQRVVR